MLVHDISALPHGVKSERLSLLPAESVDHPKADENGTKADVEFLMSVIRGATDHLEARPVRRLSAITGSSTIPTFAWICGVGFESYGQHDT